MRPAAAEKPSDLPRVTDGKRFLYSAYVGLRLSVCPNPVRSFVRIPTEPILILLDRCPNLERTHPNQIRSPSELSSA